MRRSAFGYRHVVLSAVLSSAVSSLVTITGLLLLGLQAVPEAQAAPQPSCEDAAAGVSSPTVEVI